MKASPRDINTKLTRPDPTIRAYLVYGPDRGLVRERGDLLTQSVLDDPDDPFALTLLTEDDLKADPAALADAMVAMSLTGGARLVRVRLNGETGNGPILDFLKELDTGAVTSEAIMLVESGDLTPRGKLRKGFEPSSTGLAVPCYADSARDLSDLVDTILKEAGLTLNPTAREEWLPRLEGDRALARNEIEKLVLYMGPAVTRDRHEISLEDVAAIASGLGDAALDDIIGPVFLGDLQAADSAYMRATSSGTSEVAILRALQRRLDQIGAIHASGGQEQAGMRLGAPRFGPAAIVFKQHVRIWQGRKLEMARNLVFEAERMVKRSGAPTPVLIGNLVLRLARGAAVRSR